MTHHVVVIDRAAGWVVENHGEFATRTDAQQYAKKLRGDYARRPPMLSVDPKARNLNDSLEVRVIDRP